MIYLICGSKVKKNLDALLILCPELTVEIQKCRNLLSV